MRNLFLCILVIIAVVSCRKKQSDPLNVFHDSVLQRIVDFQDQRLTDSLIPYLNSTNDLYKWHAINAFASIQDSIMGLRLAEMISNSNTNTINKALALAVGQIGQEETCNTLMEKFKTYDSIATKGAILRALGRCMNDESVDEYANLEFENNELKQAHAWGIYRAGLNGYNQDALVKKALQYLGSSHTVETRLGAAHYLGRTGDIKINAYENELFNSSKGDPSPEVRMASALALSKIERPSVNNHLLDILEKENDYRVLINSLRSLGRMHKEKNIPVVIELLDHENSNVAVQAASYLGQHANGFHLDDLEIKLDSIQNFRVKAAITKLLVDELGSARIWEMIENASNQYEQAALIDAAPMSIESLNKVKQLMINRNTHKSVSTAASSKFAALRKSEDFPNDQKEAFINGIIEGFETNDIAVIGNLCALLTDEELNFKEEIDDISFLLNAQENLSLPRDVETHQEIQKAIDYFNGQTYVPTKPAFQHPIDWDFVATIRKDQQVLLNTSKGEIVMEMHVEESPGSVAAIAKLVKDGYYNGKTFHRVVPNFVAQGGCPRGDGWGSLDYTIRSEFNHLNYSTGTVGLASAGKDTESCQWFITHSPTPHLDGRYSIIATVLEGMDVVHQLEMGDVIESMELR